MKSARATDPLKDIWPSDEDQRHRQKPASSLSSIAKSIFPDVRYQTREAQNNKPAVTNGGRRAPISAGRPIGKAHAGGAVAEGHAAQLAVLVTTSTNDHTVANPTPSCWTAAAGALLHKDGRCRSGLQLLRNASITRDT